MAIEWTPWFNVPWHRRMEVFAIAFFIFSVIFSGPICTILIIYLLFAGNIYLKIICAAYVIFFIYDIKSADRGGRGAGSAWVRGWCIWKHAINYFPIDLVKTADLPPDRNYLVCIFPHGPVSLGAGGNFSTSHSEWSTLFPGMRPKLATLRFNLLVPVARELVLSLGHCSVSASALITLLAQSNDPDDKSNRDGYTANAVGLIVGGEREQRYTYPDTYRFFVKSRKGFVKIALKTGAPLVPAISFGENNYFTISKLRSTEKTYKFPPAFCGRGFLQYNFGILPKRHPITTVIGAPIQVEKILNPTQDDIDKVHEIFCTQLRQLFEEHKSKYVNNYEEVEVEFF